MQKNDIDFNKLKLLLFDRRQITSLLKDIETWRQIPLEDRFDLVDSGEFVALMGTAFTADTRQMLETELVAKISTHH